MRPRPAVDAVAIGAASPAHRRPSRWRLASLWVSLVARAASDAGLRLYAVLLAAGSGPGQREAAWYLVTALFMLPCMLLAPVNGPLANSLPRRGLLVGSSAFMLGCLLVLGLAGGGWATTLTLVALTAIGSAVYGPARFATLAAAARDSGWPLTRVTAAVEAGAVLAMVAGMLMVGRLMTMPHGGPAPAAGMAGRAPAIAMLSLLSVVCLVAAMPARFASDVRRPEAALAALQGFARDGGRIWRCPAARSALIGIALLRGVVALAVGALIAMVLAQHAGDPASAFERLLAVALLAMAGTGVGAVLAGAVGDATRGQRFVALGSCGLALCLAWVAWRAAVPLWLCAGVGLSGGLVNVPLLVRYQLALPEDARGNGMALLSTAGHLAMVLFSAAMAALVAARVLEVRGQLVAAAAMASAAALWAGLSGQAPGRPARR